MEIPNPCNHEDCSSSMAHPRGLHFTNLEQYLKFVEPNSGMLHADLRYLARYMVKFGYNFEPPAKTWIMKGIKLQNDPEIDLDRIASLFSKYDLNCKEDRDKSETNSEINKSFYNVAMAFPQQFIDTAAGLSPGTFDERRFWHCANNSEYWSKHYECHRDNITQLQRRGCPHRLLSDVLHVLLTPKELKLIKLCALRATVGYSNDVISPGTFWQNFVSIRKVVQANEWGELYEKQKIRLRLRYGIQMAERELRPIKIESFIELWNLTSLRFE